MSIGTVQTTVPGRFTTFGGGADEGKAKIEDERRTELNEAVAQGKSASTLLTKLNEIKQLTDYINANGAIPQAGLAVVGAVASRYHIALTDTAKAKQLLDNIYSSELPDVLKAAGVQRVAGPEIMQFKVVPGTSDMPPAVVNDIIARQAAFATQMVNRGNEAYAVLRSDAPMSWDDFQKADQQRTADAAQNVKDFQSRYGGLSAKLAMPQSVPQVAVPSMGTMPPTGGGGGGGPPQPEGAPPPVAPPAAAPPGTISPMIQFNLGPNGLPIQVSPDAGGSVTR